MNRPNNISLDDLLFDLKTEGVEPTHANLLTAIARHPQHRDALIAYFAAAGADLGPEDEDDLPAPNAARLVSRGVSRALNLMHARASSANAATADTARDAPRLSALAKRKGFTLAALATQVGLDETIVLKLDRRRIRPRTVPSAAYERLGQELRIPAAEVIASATGPPVAASAGRLMKAKGPLVRNTESFLEAVERSAMSDDLKAHWLALAPEEEDR